MATTGSARRSCASKPCPSTTSNERTHTQKYPSGLAGLINKLQFHIGAAQNKACPHHSVLLPLFPRDFNSRPNLIFWAGRIWPGPSLRFYPSPAAPLPRSGGSLEASLLVLTDLEARAPIRRIYCRLFNTSASRSHSHPSRPYTTRNPLIGRD